MNQASYRALQHRAKALGLKAVGTNDVLVARIENEEKRLRALQNADVYLLGGLLPQELVLREITTHLDIRSILCLALVDRDQKRCFSDVNAWVALFASYSHRDLQRAIKNWAKTTVLLSPFLELIERLADRIDLLTIEYAYIHLLEREMKIAASRLKELAIRKHKNAENTYLKRTIADLSKLRTNTASVVEDIIRASPARPYSLSRMLKFVPYSIHYSHQQYIYEILIDSLTKRELLDFVARLTPSLDDNAAPLLRTLFLRDLPPPLLSELLSILNTEVGRPLIASCCTKDQWLSLGQSIGPSISVLPSRNRLWVAPFLEALIPTLMTSMPWLTILNFKDYVFVSVIASTIQGLTTFYSPEEIILTLNEVSESIREHLLSAIRFESEMSHTTAWLQTFERLLAAQS